MRERERGRGRGREGRKGRGRGRGRRDGEGGREEREGEREKKIVLAMQWATSSLSRMGTSSSLSKGNGVIQKLNLTIVPPAMSRKGQLG